MRASLLLPRAMLALSTTIKDWTHQLKEEIQSPRGWIKLGQPPRTHIIHLRVGLPQLKFGELERQLFEISNPYHYKYGQHLSKDDVEALVAPGKISIRLVDEWLESFGIPKNQVSRSPANDWVMINISVSLAEEMLNTVSPWRFHNVFNTLVHPCTRNTTSGSISPVVTVLFELPATAYPVTSTNISMLFNPRLYSVGSKPRNPRLFSQAQKLKYWNPTDKAQKYSMNWALPLIQLVARLSRYLAYCNFITQLVIPRPKKLGIQLGWQAIWYFF